LISFEKITRVNFSQWSYNESCYFICEKFLWLIFYWKYRDEYDPIKIVFNIKLFTLYRWLFTFHLTFTTYSLLIDDSIKHWLKKAQQWNVIWCIQLIFNKRSFFKKQNTWLDSFSLQYECALLDIHSHLFVFTLV
jgi:hypothetical protein